MKSRRLPCMSPDIRPDGGGTMGTLRDASKRLGVVVHATLNYRRRHGEAARGSFVDHLLAFPGAIERARAAARPVKF